MSDSLDANGKSIAVSDELSQGLAMKKVSQWIMMRFMLRVVAVISFGGISLLSSCAPLPGNGVDYAPSATVTPQQAREIAESYKNHLWVAQQRNVQHGADSDGVRVDTPDASLKKGAAPRGGWWQVGALNKGIPYKWGGFDTPLEFDRKLKEGKFAGDVYTQAKRAALYAGVSEHACGIDCSGFISRCWKLERAYSTRELPKLCKKLNSYNDLQPGDILNRRNVHVVLFDGFVDESRQEMYAYQTGSAPSWKVLRYKINTEYLKRMGYKPYRYKGMVNVE